MDIFFQDPNEVPLPPAEVRIRELRAEPWPDGRRVRVYLEVDPFQKRPCAELTILDPAGRPLAATSVVESMTRRIELTMHLRGDFASGVCSLEAVLYYQGALPEPGEPAVLPPIQNIDRKQIQFDLQLPLNE